MNAARGAACLVLAVLAGCGSIDASSTTSSVTGSAVPSSVSALDDGLPPVRRVTTPTPVLWDNVSTLRPLPADVEPVISEAEAFAVAATVVDAFDDPGERRAAVVLLGQLTTSTPGGIGVDGGHPAYVIIGGHQRCPVSGPPDASPHPDTVPCVNAVTVDAETGELGRRATAENPPPLDLP